MLLAILIHWGESLPEYDFNKDGVIGAEDMIYVLTHWDDFQPNPLPIADELTCGRITWHFDTPVEYGEYVNGDYWILDDGNGVEITTIEVANGDRRSGAIANRDGSDLNCEVNTTGHDSRMSAFDSSERLYPPFTVVAGDRLVSAESDVLHETGTYPEHRPHLIFAAVLTVVDEPPVPGSFRPPYMGDDPGLTTANLNLGLLPSMPMPVTAPAPSSIVDHNRWLFLDHRIGWSGRFWHPDENMESYGREITQDTADALLMLCLDLDPAVKREIAIHVCQRGIDIYGMATAGMSWVPDGGHHMGRKAYVVTAGHLLGYLPMRNIGTSTMFQEDAQTFMVSVEDIHRGVGYSIQHLGMPEWGIRHATNPDQDGPNEHSYRDLNARVWKGQAIATLLMGLGDAWGHPPYFLYVDRHHDEINSGVQTSFHEDMFLPHWKNALDAWLSGKN